VAGDDMLARLAQVKHMQDQNIAFYTEKLAGIVDAYRKNTKKYDREQLLANMSKAFTEVGNSPQDLAQMLVIAVDQLARK
jgi:hypothetical protein